MFKESGLDENPSHRGIMTAALDTDSHDLLSEDLSIKNVPDLQYKKF